MPSFQIHLAVAKRYIEKHKIVNEESFIEGNIAPDFVRPKEKSHYTIETTSGDLLEKMKNKVDLERYLRENEIKTDYDKGIFLHLLTDKIFFSDFFDREVIQKINHQEFNENLYISYEEINFYLKQKYPIIISKSLMERMKQDIEKSKIEKQLSLKEGKQIISLEKLDAFIERTSDIDLDTYIKLE